MKYRNYQHSDKIIVKNIIKNYYKLNIYKLKML